MIRPPSNIRQYAEHWSEDPAFEQAPPVPAKTATDDERRVAEQALETYAAKLSVAWETGDWSALRVTGAGEPTTFLVKPLSSEVFGKLIDAQANGTGEHELHQLAFRCALQSVTQLEGAKVAFVEDEQFGRIASLAFFEDVGITGALGQRIIRDIGGRILRRAATLSPKRSAA